LSHEICDELPADRTCLLAELLDWLKT